MTGVVPIDHAERERIRTDLSANLCVEAGAGTGKTTVLVGRVVEALRAGHANVDQIAVITFTEAAAAELSGRVRQGLEDALEASAGDDRERIRTALDGLHRAHIETIHAFAAGLLRERPVEAGLDPGFEVLDDLGAELGYRAAYDAWLQGVLSEESSDVVMAIRRGFGLTEIDKLAAAVHAHRGLLPLQTESAPTPIPAFLDALQRAAATCAHLLPRAGGDEVGAADMEAIIDFTQRLHALRGAPEDLDREILYRAPTLNPSRGRQTDWDDASACAESKECRKGVRQAIAAAQAALRAQALVAILPLVEGFVAGYEAQRRAEGTADYDDLLEWSRDMLLRSSEARQYFRGRFRMILVDEFQDTDPVQAEIALLIASDDDPGDDLLDLRPRPGALTVAGDPKQSIYRFRRADIAVYDAIRRGPLAGGDATLVQNFRSVGGVLAFVNTLFDRVLVQVQGVQPANTPLVVGDARLDDESLSVCVIHGEPAGDRADEVRGEEARLLATQIRDAIASGWTVRDPRSGMPRPATYGDVAVLLPRRTALDIYLDAFRRAEVPVRAEGGRSFFQRQEVRDLANVLLAIDDPLDRVALVASLRAGVFGCTDEEIFLHHAAGNALDYRLDHTESPASVAQAMEILNDLHDLRSRVSLAQLVRTTLARTRLVEFALAGWDGPQSAANLVKLADRARAFSAREAGGLRAFARWLTDQRASSDEAEASIAEESDEVVRVMTIHASKGLEFPIVALANLQTQPRVDIEPVPDRRARRLHLRVTHRKTEFKTPGFDAAWSGETEQKEAEEKRLLYVAATRARDHLIIPVATPAPKSGSMLGDLHPSLPAADPATAGTLVDGCFVIDPAGLAQLPEGEPPLRADAPEDEVAQAIDAREAWATAREDVMRQAREALEVYPATKDEGDAPMPPSLAGADDAPLIAAADHSPPRLKGEALHRVLELIDLRHPTDVAQTVRSVCVLGGIEDTADEVQQMVEACLESPVLARALKAEALWREVPYTVRVEDGYATGRIDLVFREGDALVVADWKSDSIGPSQAEAAAEGHRPQAEAYVRALEAAAGLPVKEVVFVFARARSERSMAPRR